MKEQERGRTSRKTAMGSGMIADMAYREYSVGISIDDDTGASTGGVGVWNYSSDGSVDESRGGMEAD